MQVPRPGLWELYHLQCDLPFSKLLWMRWLSPEKGRTCPTCSSKEAACEVDLEPSSAVPKL